tara:strand:+ start:139 stop:408 length:270 start_codon:yes stop_codon:yes gene_type:complete
MNEEWIKKYNKDAEKHNKRVKSIRDSRLPKSCVKALDQAIRAMDVMTFQIQESVINNHNCITMDDMIQLGSALEKIKKEFEERELRSVE